MAFFYVLYLCHSKAPVLNHSNSGLFQSTTNCVTINPLKRHRACKETWKENFSSPMQFQETSSRDNTHTHTKPGSNNSFRIPRAKTFHQNLKREVKEMQHAKLETWKELLLLLSEGNFEKRTPGGHNNTHTHTHTHIKVGKQQYNFFSLPRAEHPTDLLINRYSPLLAPDSSTSLSVTGGLFVCLFAVRAIENKRQIILEIEIASKANKKTQKKTSNLAQEKTA